MNTKQNEILDSYRSTMARNDRDSLRIMNKMLEDVWKATVSSYVKVGRVWDPGGFYYPGGMDTSEEYHCHLKYIPGIYD